MNLKRRRKLSPFGTYQYNKLTILQYNYNKLINLIVVVIKTLLNNMSGVCEFFSSNTNIDVLTLSKTRVTEYNNDSELYKIPGYNFLQKTRENCKDE